MQNNDDENLDLDDFEVARSEFFSDIREPAFVFNDGKVGVNTACVRRLPILPNSFFEVIFSTMVGYVFKCFVSKNCSHFGIGH